MSQVLNFSSAYRQLQPYERTFVDGYVNDLESYAVKHGERLTLNLCDQVPVQDRYAPIAARALVQAAIVERLRDINERMQLSVYKTLRTLSNVAYSNIADYMTPSSDGKSLVIDFSKCTPDQMEAVKTFKIKERMTAIGPVQEIEITLHDKMSAIDKVMKNIGLLDDRHWRSENAKTVKVSNLTADVSDDDAANSYARMING